MDNKLERAIEIMLALSISGFGSYALMAGYLSGTHYVVVIGLAFALYQSTSVAEIMSRRKED